MAFDNIFKIMMRELLKSCDAKTEKVGTLLLEIDMVARCDRDKPVLPTIPLITSHFSSDNLLEYKSEADKATKESLSKLLGYVGLYCNQHGIGIDEARERVTTWYISAKRPSFLNGLLASKIAVMASDAGVYDVITGFPCPCRVVVCDELDMTDANIPLLALGSVETVKKAIEQLARAGAEMRRNMGTIKSLIYYFYYDEVKDMTEMKQFTPADIRRNVKHAIEDIGIEEAITDLGIKRVVEAVGVDKVIDAVGVDKVIDAVGVDKLKEAIARKEAKGASSRKSLKKR
ncbi:MAG: hypothetical protein GYA24_21360 [Candidatus Lokiarchaeota archaeon]|nr:hypothetical protein [Candidatus Lokiarchaeota archaeon]